HRTALRDLILADDRDVVLADAGDDTRAAARAGVQIDRHRPAALLLRPQAGGESLDLLVSVVVVHRQLNEPFVVTAVVFVRRAQVLRPGHVLVDGTGFFGGHRRDLGELRVLEVERQVAVPYRLAVPIELHERVRLLHRRLTLRAGQVVGAAGLRDTEAAREPGGIVGAERVGVEAADGFAGRVGLARRGTHLAGAGAAVAEVNGNHAVGVAG